MKRVLFFLALLFFCFSVSFGQTSSDQITMKKAFGGYKFFQGDSRLNMSQLVKTMKSDAQAYEEIKAAQSTYTWASIVGFAGGFMVGWPLGTAIAGGEPNWAMAGIGAGLIVVAIPISSKFNKQAKNAVDTFNRGLSTRSFWDKAELGFVYNGNGLGLTMRF